MKKFLILSNWKSNGNKILINKIIKIIKKTELNKIRLVIFPPIIYIDYILKEIKNINNLYIGVQNIDSNKNGLLTGEISVEMIKDFEIKYVIVGHYERRNFYNENNELIINKLKLIKNKNLIPILCIGENIDEYNKKNSIKFCVNQIKFIIENSNIDLLENICIAYEPIWSIGSGKIPNIEHIVNIFNNIKKYLSKINKKIISNIYFIYGGSVTSKNIKDIFFKDYLDGFLIGKSSIIPNEFKKIINILQLK